MKSKGCIKCGSSEAGQKEVAMTGTGLSKMFDVQHNRFLVVYCKNADIQNSIIEILQWQEMFSIFSLEAKYISSIALIRQCFFKQKILLTERNVRKLSRTQFDK